MIGTVESSIVWSIMVCSPVKVNRRFRGTYRLYFQGRSVRQACCLLHAGFCLAYSWTLKMEKISSSETSVDFHRTTQSYIPEDSHCCQNLKYNEWYYNSRLDNKRGLYQNQVVVLVKQEAYYFIFGARGWSRRDTSWRSTRLSTIFYLHFKLYTTDYSPKMSIHRPLLFSLSTVFPNY
jgi:hypothetical protein